MFQYETYVSSKFQFETMVVTCLLVIKCQRLIFSSSFNLKKLYHFYGITFAMYI